LQHEAKLAGLNINANKTKNFGNEYPNRRETMHRHTWEAQ
jgi:hypothetical protein